ncbi:MAG: transporter ATP-binding protein [Flaviaesturariibacter sp.]|nr:transporter ATP-binding protein [Flaviaesturariibacter sp.]
MSTKGVSKPELQPLNDLNFEHRTSNLELHMEPIISIKNLFKNYGPKPVLKDINLDVYPGQVIGYIGPNGAGKSTTVKILCGLLTDYEGTVTIKGFDLKKDTLNVKRIIGYVPELAELYDVLTPREYLQFSGALYELEEAICNERIERMMQAFGLADNIDQRMDSFSKGMRQKVLLASGILHNPDIIILDEPLSGLDANSVIIVKELISKLAKDGKTIFYCSHMMDVVEKVSDRIVLIDEGRIIANGTIEELKEQQGNTSLEQIFAKMTGKDSLSVTADELMRALG